jgi:hypothetical protein
MMVDDICLDFRAFRPAGASAARLSDIDHGTICAGQLK